MEATGPASGFSPAGDINGDGFGDVMIAVQRGAGPANDEASAGEAIVVFGKAGGFADIDVSSSSFVSSGQGFRIFGADSNDSAYFVSSAGDIKRRRVRRPDVGQLLWRRQFEHCVERGRSDYRIRQGQWLRRCRRRFSESCFVRRGLPNLWRCRRRKS